MTAACDSLIANTIEAAKPSGPPKNLIRALAMGLFDAIDAHPWIGSALTRAPGQMPMVRILERLGQQVRAMGVPERAQWSAASALLNYILGVSGQNAMNAQIGREQSADRTAFLEAVSVSWLQLDAKEYPFTRSAARLLSRHDDRADFLAGIDLILAGIDASQKA